MRRTGDSTVSAGACRNGSAAAKRSSTLVVTVPQATTIIFTQVGIPLEAVALLAGVDRILDMIRTSINVVGDVAAAVIVTKMEGDLNSEPYVEGAD